MDIIIKLVLVIHIIVSVLLIITVLLQPGRSGDLGSIFGGTSESVFGASGAVPFLVKVTRFLAAIFMVTSLSLGYFSAKGITSSVVEDLPLAPVEQEQESVVPPEEQTESAPEAGNPAETEVEQESIETGDEQSQSEVQKPQEETKEETEK